MSWRNRRFKRSAEVVYPFIQWINDGGSLQPRSEIGGFAMDTDQANILGANIPGEMRVAHHRGGGATEMVFSTELEAAILDTRFTWVKNKRPIPNYEPGARSKLQALALVRSSSGEVAGPVMVTFKGYASKHFGEALKAHRERVRVGTSNEAPAYAFFGAYHAGKVELVGSNQQSPITTLVYGDNGDVFDPDAAYVGDEALDALVDWDQVDAWKKAWNGDADADSDVGDGHHTAGNNGSGRNGGHSPRNPNAKATPKQWEKIRGLLADIKYAGKDRQDRAIEEAGFDPVKLTSAQADKLLKRLEAAVQAAAKK